MPVPQENSSLVERASCPFLRMVQDVSYKQEPAVFTFLYNTGDRLFSYKSLDWRANPPETVLILTYLAVKSKNQPTIPVPRQHRESKKLRIGGTSPLLLVSNASIIVKRFDYPI
ncbi:MULTISPECIES: hypothetical protein [unclassified Microcoleus]|uniref:hypothetical protein n=1 Tax=unclassified Microcoleus TaxID=2642155 RepID=UPI002FD05DD2